MAQSKDLSPQLIKRPEYYFEVPEAARLFPEKDIKSFKLRSYTLADEIDAARVAVSSGDTKIAMETELIRRAVFEVNGNPVTDHTWLDEQGPGVRALLSLALAKASNPPGPVVDDFLKSMVVTG